MKTCCLIWILALGIAGCGKTHENLSDLADSFAQAVHRSGPGLSHAADHARELLDEAKASEDLRAVVKGAACTSAQIYGDTGRTPSALQFSEIMSRVAAQQHLSIPSSAALRVRNAALALVSEAQQATQNSDLTPSQQALVISGDLGCTASNILPVVG